MNSKTYDPVKIQLTTHGVTRTIEGLDWDIGGNELIQEFRGLMHSAGYPINKVPEEEEWVMSK